MQSRIPLYLSVGLFSFSVFAFDSDLEGGRAEIIPGRTVELAENNGTERAGTHTTIYEQEYKHWYGSTFVSCLMTIDTPAHGIPVIEAGRRLLIVEGPSRVKTDTGIYTMEGFNQAVLIEPETNHLVAKAFCSKDGIIAEKLMTFLNAKVAQPILVKVPAGQ